jgi:pyridoxamine 5'-phosphate oxidase
MSDLLNQWRRDYEDESPLLERDVAGDPIEQFRAWFDEAAAADFVEPNAMTLATCAADGTPSARIVLLKEFDARGFVFYTSYEGAKAAELADNPRAELLFFWDKLGKSVRINGTVTKVPRSMSEAYFATRPVKSQLGAWASHQSRPIESREALRDQFEQMAERFGDGEAPTPPHWGGYRVVPERIEFWQGQRSRLHDRLLYIKQRNGDWQLQRLSP